MRRTMSAVALVAAMVAGSLLHPLAGAAAQAGPAPEPYLWEPVRIGGGGFVTGLVTGPTGEVYARTDVGGAYRWQPGRQRWAQMITAAGVPGLRQGDYQVEALAVAPSDGAVVYVAVGDTLGSATGRVLRSGDGGRTWTAGEQPFVVAGNADRRQGGERLAVDPSDADVVWFGTRTAGLWRSDDGGATWSPVTGLPAADPTPGDPTGVSAVLVGTRTGPGQPAAVWAAVHGVGILRSGDRGGTWSLVHPVPTGYVRHAVVDSTGRLLAAVTGDGTHVVRVDADGRRTASFVLSPWADHASVAVDPHDPDVIVVGDRGVRDGMLWRSTDGGATWAALDVAITSDIPGIVWPGLTDLEAWMSTGALVFDPARPGTLWFAEGMGVWRTTDLGDDEVTWRFAADGIEELVSNDALTVPGRPLLTAHWDRSVFRHERGGAVPALTERFNSAWDLSAAADRPDLVVAVVDDHRRCCADDGRAGESGWSDDGGTTWHRFASLVDGTHPADLRFGNLAVSTRRPDHLVWVPSNGGRVHHSSDRGRTWEPAAYPGGEPHRDHFLNRQVLVADPVRPDVFYVLDADGLMRSTDGGATWEATGGAGLPDRWARRHNATLLGVPGRPGELLLSTGVLEGVAGFGLFRSGDGGDTWVEVDSIGGLGAIGLGAGAVVGDPALYAWGTVHGAEGLWVSPDLGGRWDLVSTAPAGHTHTVAVLAGDPDEPGRVHVGFRGMGFVTGEPVPALVGDPEAPTGSQAPGSLVLPGRSDLVTPAPPPARRPPKPPHRPVPAQVRPN